MATFRLSKYTNVINIPAGIGIRVVPGDKTNAIAVNDGHTVLAVFHFDKSGRYVGTEPGIGDAKVEEGHVIF